MKLDKIIEDLYEGTLDPVAWDRAILSIADSVRASAAVLFAFNPTTGAVLRNESYRMDPQAIVDYARYWTFEDIRLGYTLALPTLEPATKVSLKIPLKGSRVYHEYLVPVDAPHFLPVWLHKSRFKAVALSLQGGIKRGPFQKRDVERFRHIVSHLARALQIRDRLEAAQVKASHLANILDRTTFGVLVLDAQRRILETNARASAMLTHDSGLQRGKDGTLEIRDSRGALAKCMSNESARGCVAEALMHVPRPGKLPLAILMVPLPKANTLWVSGNPACLVLVFDMEQHLLLNEQMIGRDLGLSEREAQVAAFLGAGLSVPEIARRMRVTIHTVRTQLQSVFQKTGCHSQAALVRRLLLGPGVVSPM